MTSADIMNGINAFVDSKLDTLLGSNPFTSLAQPFIKRIVKGMVKENIAPYTEDINKYLKLAADEDGNLNNVFDETIERFRTMPVTSTELAYVGDVRVGQGKISMSIPMPIGKPRYLSFNEADMVEIKNMIIDKFNKQ